MVSAFTIRIDCRRATLAEKLAAQKCADLTDPKGSVIQAADQTHIELVKAKIAAIVDKLAPQFDGVLIVAQGQFDAANGRMLDNVQVCGKTGMN